ncbi:hypothetical protein [Bifidobacterium callimiconis]|uniref:Uncharacterized protein n=1 Tax=Bifidobacterium callimiconis TaxID=2306973 RepID=A0A430FBH8_9BIFI|nr:hypothetical protein [Bifidobacterium callimiconis]RSX50204.1 hypothetical protein D2E23_1752 [Bifidobacterium callimiconis]
MHAYLLLRWIQDHADWVLYVAVVMLPVDGTVIGGYMPYWTPVSPWLFMAYAVLNARYWQLLDRRIRLVVVMPVALLVVSVFGWVTIGFRWGTVFLTCAGLFGASACVFSLCIAKYRGLDFDRILTVMLSTYWLAFAVGVVQFVAIAFRVDFLIRFFEWFMVRSYIGGPQGSALARPQFLFAEPSYIGMHLYGVLLPLFWITRKRRILALIVTFAGGAMLMGSGVRIILDSAVAVVLSLVALVNWKRMRNRIVATVSLVPAVVFFVFFLVGNQRVQTLLSKGLISGDESVAARLLRFLILLEAGLHDIPHLIFGYGAGNIYDSFGAGMRRGLDLYARLNGGRAYYASDQWTDVQHLSTPRNMFTMSAYSSLLAEFGIMGIGIICITVFLFVHVKHAWSLMTVSWVILITYLYFQFEGYAFYALPLFIWYVETVNKVKSMQLQNE